jgi:murein DD-endopeptidase MepM/ murein hydrolase activator NlpD
VKTREDRESLNLIRDAFTALVRAPRQKPNDAAFFLGNHIIMRSAQGIYALFAHLRKDSVAVRQGERVRAGDAIAAIGNSGNTIQPHLHFQLMQDNAPFTAILLAFVFSAYERQDGDAWKSQVHALPSNRQVFRAVEAG